MATLSTSADPRRVRDLDGARNFRDLGGYATQDGRRVRWGRVFRSAKLSKLTDPGVDALEGLAISSVFDLRTAEERAAEPSRWRRPPTHVYESLKPTMRPLMEEILEHAQDEPTAHQAMQLMYSRFPELYREEFAQLFRRLVQGGTPLLLHCAAGKDRTGVASALVLSALQVPREQVIEDYAMTEKLVDAKAQAARHQVIAGPASMENQMAAKPQSVQIVFWRSTPDFINASFAAIERGYGSIEGYLSRGLGLSDAELQALRDQLIE